LSCVFDFGFGFGTLLISSDIGDKKTIDRRVYLNTPLSIQVVTPKLQERRLVQAMAIIDEVLKPGRESSPHARL
jgi:amidase